MAANNTTITGNMGAVPGSAFTQTGTVNNMSGSNARGVLKPCFKTGCALNCKHKTAACFKATTQQAC